MHRRGIQRLLSAHPQEAGTLFKGFRSQFADLFKVCTGGKPVFIPIGNNILGNGVINARHMAQKFHRGRLKVHADRGHTVLHHTRQRPLQLRLLEIVLILADTNGLGVNLDQFRQRILHAPRNGNRSALKHRILGQFLGRVLGGRPYAGAGLVDNGVGDTRQFRQKGGDKLLAFPGSRSVSNRNSRHMMPPAHADNHLPGLFLLPLLPGQRKERNARLKDAPGGIHHRQLAAVMVTRIHAKGHPSADRRLHQELPQVVGKDMDGALVGPVRQLIHQLTVQGGLNQAVPGILGRQTDLVPGGAVIFHIVSLNDLLRAGGTDLHRHPEEALLFAPVQRKNPVIGRLQDRLGIVLILGIDIRRALCVLNPVLAALDVLFLCRCRRLGLFLCRRFFLFNLLAGQLARAPHKGPQLGADIRIVRHHLGNDVPGHGQRFFRAFNFIFRIHIRRGKGHGIIRGLLLQNGLRQRLQPFLPGDNGTGAPLRPVRQIQVLKNRQGGRRLNLCPQRLIQFALGLNGPQNGLPALFQSPQIFKPLTEIAQLLVIHFARLFFPVPGDEGNGVSLINQRRNRFRDLRLCIKLSGKYD